MGLVNNIEADDHLVTLPGGKKVDISHFEEYSDWRIYGKEMPLFFKKPEDFFKYKFGDDWHTIFRLEDQLRSHIEQMPFTQDRLNSGWWGYEIKYIERSEDSEKKDSYEFHCIWGCDEPCDPGIITMRYIINPSFTILEEKETDFLSPHFR